MTDILTFFAIVCVCSLVAYEIIAGIAVLASIIYWTIKNRREDRSEKKVTEE